MFPLELLAPFWAALLKAVPFQHLAYFPVAVFLGKIPRTARVNGRLGELG